MFRLEERRYKVQKYEKKIPIEEGVVIIKSLERESSSRTSSLIAQRVSAEGSMYATDRASAETSVREPSGAMKVAGEQSRVAFHRISSVC